MPIEFKCSQCGRLLRTPDDSAGKQAKCPQCEAIQSIPHATVSAAPSPPPVDPTGAAAAGSETDQGTFTQPPPPPPPQTGDPNPYQAPQFGAAPAAIPPGTGVFQPSRIDVGDILNRAWVIFQANWPMVILVMFVAYLLTTIVSHGMLAVIGLLNVAIGDNVVIVIGQTLQNIIVQVFSLWIGLGVQLYLLRTSRGEASTFGDLFGGGRFLLPAIGASILLFLLIGGILAVFLSPGLLLMVMIGFDDPTSIVVMAIGGVISAPIIIFLWIAFSQYQFLCVDRGAGPVESLMLSWEITKGNRLMVLLVWLVSMAINVVGVLACCVGMIATFPFTVLMMAVTYLAMTGQPTIDRQYAAPAEPAPGVDGTVPQPGG